MKKSKNKGQPGYPLVFHGNSWYSISIAPCNPSSLSKSLSHSFFAAWAPGNDHTGRGPMLWFWDRHETLREEPRASCGQKTLACRHSNDRRQPRGPSCRSTTLLSILLLLASNAIECCAQAAAVPRELRPWLEPQPWNRDVDAPIVALGKAGDFDDTHIFRPCGRLRGRPLHALVLRLDRRCRPARFPTRTGDQRGRASVRQMPHQPGRPTSATANTRS